MNKILLVEDEINLGELIRRELQIAGYQVDHVTDGLQALPHFRAVQPDLLVLDWVLPGLNGLDILKLVRKESTLPILMLTARSDPADRVLGLELGSDDYLVKPFSMPELVARVKALFRREQRIRDVLEFDQMPAKGILVYAELILNPFLHSCSLEGIPIELSPLEFELLSLLLAHPGRTFNRMYLVETVWKTSFIEGDRSVDNTVLRLRKKLAHLGECLETVRGIGYRFRRECDAPLIGPEAVE